MSKALGRMMLLLCALMSAQAFAQTIAISSPSAGDSWGRGAKHAITWSSSGVTDSVRIEYITGGVATTLAAAADNNGDYEWDVPASQTLGSYTVRLTSVVDVTVTATSGAFNIVNPAIAITAPNGGETWALETTRDIKWTSDVGGNVRIDLLNSGSVYATIAESVANSGSYSWSIPEFTVIPAGDYTVKISLVNNQSVSCVSTDTFALYNPNVTAPVTVTNPTGGESWVIGSQHQVTWDSIVGGTVKIDLFQYYYDICTMAASGDNGGTFRIAGNQTANLVSGDTMAITDSTGNNGYYNVSSVTGVQDYIVTATKSKMPEDDDQVSGGPYPGFCIAGWKAIGVSGKVGSGEFTYNDGLVVYGSPGNDGNYTIRGAENVTIGGVNHTWIYLKDTTIPSTNFGGNILRTVITTNTGVYNAAADGYISKIVKNIAAEVDNSAATNSYAWTIPVDQPAGLHFGIRVTSNLNEKWTGGSAEELTLSPEPYILLQSPNGGESWAANASQTVKWDSNAGGDVKLEYSANGGVNWTTIVASAPNSGSYSWKTPNATGDTYLLKITSTADAAVTCTSAAPFSLTAPYITLSSPAGGENWAAGRTFPISWTSNLIGVGGSDANVAIYLSSDAGATWSTIVASTANVGLYYWQIPDDQQIGDQYKVKIVSAAATGVSPATFAISGKPFVQVTSPSLGDIWAVGAQRSITWETNIQGYVKIELYQNDLKKADIVSSTANNGSYLWMSPGPAGTGYTVKVTSATDDTVTDSSELFNIAAVANITVTSPTDTDSWAAGTAQTIAWTSNIGGNVKLELGQGGSWTTIVTGISNAMPSNSYTWNIPVGTAAGSYQVRITSESNGAVSPVASFAITAPTITVTAPAAGVIWGKGGASGNSSHLITWDSTAAASNSVAIFYSANGVAPWHSITDAIPNSGSYTWSMPSSLAVGSGYKIEVRSVVTPSIKGTSNAFSVAAPAIDMQIEDGSPNGGEAWLAGSAHDIVWYSNIGGSVSIQLYKGGSPVSTISASYANSDESDTPVHDMYKQTYSWILPTTLASGTDYTVVVRSLSLTGIEGMTTSLGKFTISSVPYLNVLSPAVGDICCRGLAKNILWESNAGGNVKIELGKLASGKVNSWATLIDSTPNDGAYQWTLASDLALGDYTVRVSGVEDQDLSVESGTFAVEDAKLAISVPATGAVLGQGSTVSLAWASNIGGNVKIALYKGASLNSVLAAETENDGAFTWQVPASQAVGVDYTVMITSLALPAVTASSGAFAVAAPSLVITYPNGGESLVYGTVETIRWTSNLSGNVKIELYQNSKLADTIAASVSDSGTYEWKLSTDGLIAGAGYKVQISCLDAQTPVKDLSDASFKIIAPNIEVTKPTAIDEWKTGGKYHITWTSNFIGNVGIDLYKGGVLNSIIAANIENDSDYIWTVPVDLKADSDYSIRVYCDGEPETYGQSAQFAVVKSHYISLTSPVGDENWARSTNHEIRWKTDFTGDNKVKISLLKDDVLYQEIASATENDGLFIWAMSADVAAGSQYTIQIISLQDSTVLGVSPNTFTIADPYLSVLVPNDASFSLEWTAGGGTTAGMKADSGDFDGDGKLDVCVANSNGQANKMFYGKGDGTFDAVDLPGNYNSQYIVSADVDSDNDLDLVVANADGGAAIYLNSGGRNFSLGTELIHDDQTGATSVAVGDVNGDKLNDIIVGYNSSSSYYYSYGHWQIWLNDPKAPGTFTFSKEYSTSSRIVKDIKLADFDNDGDLDVALIVQGSPSYLYVYLNDGTGSFPSYSYQYWYSVTLNAIAVGDLDGDGSKDIVLARQNAGSLVMRNNGSGQFDASQALGDQSAMEVVLSDLNGDNHLDAVFGNCLGSANSVYLNDGTGILNDSNQPVQDYSKSNGVVVADFTGDGGKDIFYADYGSQNKLYANIGSVRWTAGTKHDIIWTSNLGGSVKLELCHTSGSQLVVDYLIESDVDNNGTNGTYSWTVPVDQQPGTNYVIQVTSEFGQQGKSGVFTIQYGSYLLLNTPNGGDKWIAGTENKIQWDANFSGNIEVEYTDSDTADSVVWSTIAIVQASAGTDTWIVPDTINSDNCKVRLTSIDYPALVDMSDASFSVKPKFVEVATPTEGDVWNKERIYEITWSSNLKGNVDIWYSPDSGLSWDKLAEDIQNDGTYTWDVTVDSSNQAMIKVAGTESGPDSGVEGMSGLFSINNASFIDLTSPNGGERWALETQRQITWKTSLTSGNLRIDLLKGGEIYKTLATGIPVANGSYTWNIPEFTVVPAGIDYAIELSLVDDQTIFDVSETYFVLQNPNVSEPITVTRPSGGDTWMTGSQQRITWTSIVGGTVKIDLFQYYFDLCSLVAGDAGGIFRIAGDQTAKLSVGDKLAVTNSTGNDGYYNATTVTLNKDYILEAAKSLVPYYVDDTTPVITGGPYPAFRIAGYHGLRPVNLGLVGTDEFRYGNALVVKGSSGNDGTYTVLGAEDVTVAGVQCTWIYLQDATIPSENFGGNILRTFITTDTGIYNTSVDGYLSKILKTLASTVDNSAYNNAYTWTVPVDQATGTDYGVRVTSNANNKWSGGSAAAFTIKPGAYIILDSPNGGEKWVSGNTYSITWQSNAGGSVVVSYSKDAGTTWTDLSTVSNTAGGGSYEWVTDASLSGEYFKVKVAVVNSAVQDESESVFSLTGRFLKLAAPVGGESWPLGSQQRIDWTSNIGGYVDITLLHPGDDPRIIASKVENSGSYFWDIPSLGLGADTDYQVRIVADGKTATSADFSLTADSFLQLLSPVGEEHWAIGTQRDITWKCGNIGGNILIYLYNGDVFKTQISPDAGVSASSGKYSWSIPKDDVNVAAATGYKVKLVSQAQGALESLSPKSFEIESSPYISMVSPNSGSEAWAIGSRNEIMWDSNAGGLVKIELGHYSNATWNYDSTIVASVGNTDLHNSYMWTIPPGQFTANDYRIKVTSLSGVCEPGQSSANFAIIPASYIIIGSPNGGEDWATGSTRDITWLSNYGNTVKLECSSDGGTNWATIATKVSNTAASGSYAWDTTGLAAGTHYRVKISNDEAGASSSVSDISDADFTLSNSKLVLTSPNGGESWNNGSAQTFTWSSNLGGNVKLELFRGDATDTAIVAASTPNNGSYAWTVADMPVGSDYKAKISSVEFPDSGDASDNDFAITDEPFVKLTSPVGNEHWAFGTTRSITWTTNMSADTANDVRLDLYNGGVWVKSITARTSNSGAYSWTLPTASELTAGSNYSITITCADQAFISASSPATFEIGTAFVSQMSPNGGETLIAGAKCVVTWNSNIGGTVKLDLYDGVGSFAATIAAAAASPVYSNNYSWTVPSGEFIGTDFYVRVTSNTLTDLSDYSDAAFSIAQGPYLTVAAPAGGESWAITGDATLMPTIKWGSNIGGTVKIEGSSDSGYTWNTIVASTANDGSYLWDTSALAAGVNYRIRITSLTNSSYYDASNADFILSAASLSDVQVGAGTDGSRYVGGTYGITWSSNLGGTVKIDLLQGGTVMQTIAASASNNGSCSWTVEDSLPSGNYQIRVFSNLTAQSVTSATFALGNQAFAIKLTAPVGGAKLKKGREYAITWYTTTELGTIKIELSLDLGATWTQIVAATTNAGSYKWSIPSNEDSSNNCLIRLSSNIYGEDITAQNVEPFAIVEPGAYDVIVPNGGEYWAAGTTREIRWQAYVPGEYVKIELYRSGVLVPASESGLPSGGYYSSINNYNWDIPSTLSTSDNYRIKVSSASNASDYDLSDANFQISPPTLLVTYPTGSEEWAKTLQRVKWYTNRNNAIIVDLLRGDFIDLVRTDNVLVETSTGNYYANYFFISGLYGDFFSPGDSFVVENSESAPYPITYYHGISEVIEDTANQQTILVWLSKDTAVPKSLNDGRLSWVYSIQGLVTNDVGYADWNIPTGKLVSGRDIIPAGDTYKIRVSAAKLAPDKESLIILMTNAGQTFSIVDRDQVYLNVTSPGAGVHWACGVEQTLTWNTNLGGPLQVSLLRAGTPVPVYTSLMLPDEAENLPNAGAYTWAIPKNLTPGDDYCVQLSSTQSDLAMYARSSNFSVVDKYAQIITPADDSVVAYGTQQTISWQTNITTPLRLVLYKDGTKLDAAISGISDAAFSPDSAFYEWTVPAASAELPSTSAYKIRVFSSTDATVYGENASPFSLGCIAVTAPVDSARWALGTSHTITWQSDTNVTKKVNLYLYRNSGFNSQIASNVENSGSYTWTIPSDSTINPSPDAIPPAKLIYDYYVVVVSASDSACQGRSTNYFRLEQSKTVTVLVPNGEENWGIGQYYNIKWFSNIGGHVAITLGYYDAASNWNQASVIDAKASDAGNINTSRWLVPDDLTPRSDYRVKVTGDENPEASDVSDYNFAIGPHSYIILTSPTGGEQWVRDNTYDITWKTNVAATVDIYYSANSGVDWTLLAANYTSADGVYSWDTSASNVAEGDNFRVKVVSSSDVNILGASENDFSISNAYILISAPASGQAVAIGSIFQIKWTTNLDKALSIALYKGDDQVDTIVSSTSNAGVYSWSVSSTLDSGRDYQVGIASASGADTPIKSGTFALVNADFIQVTSPLGSEKWAAGSTRSVTWGSNLAAAELVRIDLYQDDSWKSTIAASTANSGSYSWAIPAALAGGNYKVKITRIKTADVFSISLSDFLIGSPSVLLTSPNGGQSWVIGRTYDVTWESNVGGTVSIQLDKGGVIQTLVTGVDNTAFSHVQGVRMPISLEAGSDYKVVVVSESNSAWKDSSDNVFTLMPGEYLALTAPVGGETLYNGPTDYFDITWESNVGGNAMLSYSNTALESWTVIPGADSVAATKGTFRWSTSGLPTGSLYKVKIESLSASDLSSKSSAYFSVNQKDYLVLSSPVGGESWVVGSTQNITWGANIGGNLKIELLNNGVLSSVIVAETSAGNKSYAWKIPSTQNVGSNFKIRITSLQNAALTSTSAGNFTLTAPYITILSPVGGEIYSQNGTYDIRWTSSGVTDSVRVELLKGVKVTTIAERVAVASGSYSWTIPADQASGEDYKIRVSSVSNATTTSVSPSFFQITSFPPVISIEPDSQLRVQLAQGRSAERQLVVGNVGGMSLNWTIDDNYTVDSVVYTDTGVGSDTAAYTDTDYSTWTKIDGLGDDTVVGPISVGFDFPLYGQAFSSFYVSSNGWISFSADGYETIRPVELPSALAPENMVAMFWQDLNFTMGGSAYYKQVDANTFVLAFEGVQLNNFDGSVTCRMLLGRDGSVKVLYQSVVAAAATTAVVGVQDGFKTKGFTADPDMIAAGVVVELRPFWPSLSVSSGTVDPNNKQNVVLTFSSVGWAAGTYQTTIEVASEDEGVESKFLEVEFIVTDVSFLAVDDFDASGSSDLLFRNVASGGMYVNLVDGMSILGGGSLYQSGEDWDLAGVGDLNNDLKKDIIVQNTANGGIYAFLMDGANQAAAKFLCQGADSGWGVAGIADLNGDGKSDVVLRNSASGAVYLWIMNGLEIAAQDYLLLGSDSTWEFGGLADLNGDGKSDVVLRNTTNGAIYVYLMNGLKVVGQGFAWNGGDSKWTIGGFGKFDDDANADMLLCYEGGKDGYVWLMDGVKPKFGDFVWKSSDQITWQFKAVGDFNGDGRTDILLRDASTAALYIFLMDGSAASASGYILGGGDTAWDVAKVGDYNGDGKSDIMLENQAEGEGHLYLIEGLSVSAHGLVWINAQDWKLR